MFTAVGGDSTPYDDATEETAVLPNSAAARIGIARTEIQAVVRDDVVDRGLRADIRIVSSAECRAVNR